MTATGAVQYALAAGLASVPHSFEIYRRTEGAFGNTVFQGLVLDTGKTLDPPPARPSRRMIFIGDSITSGYNCDCAAPGTCGSSPPADGSSFNANMSWAPRLARLCNADYQVISQSGAGLYMDGAATPSLTDVLPVFYTQMYRLSATPLWDTAYWEKPSLPGSNADVIVIMLGTNDFSQYGHPGLQPTQAQWETAMNNFIDTLRASNQAAQIFMVGTFYNTSPYTLAVQYNNDIVATRGVPWLHSVDTQSPAPWIDMNPANGDVTSDWTHPVCYDNVHGDYKVANSLYQVIQPVMGW